MRAQRYRSDATRPNPDDGLFDLVAVGGLALVGFVVWKAIQDARATAVPGIPSASYVGTSGGTVASPATGGTYVTSHPAGHGQIYV